MKHVLWASIVIAVFCGGCGAESAPLASTTGGQTTVERICIATPGRDGGLGGIVSLNVAETPSVPPSADVTGGHAGSGGKIARGGRAASGEGADAGLFELVPAPGYTFDKSAVADAPSMIVDVGTVNQLTDTLTLDTLHVGADSLLELGGYLQIVAREIIIDEGATLRLRARTGNDQVIATPTRSRSGAATDEHRRRPARARRPS